MTAGFPRIAVVVSQFGFGGAEQQTALLLRALVDSPRRPVLVVCLSNDIQPHGPALEALGYRVVVVPRKSSFDPTRLTTLRRLLKQEQIELVHAVHLLASAYVHLAAGRSTLVLPTVRGTVVHPSWFKRWVYRRMFRSAPRTLVNSQRGAQFIIKNFDAPPDRVVVIPNGIDFAKLRQRAQNPGLRQELGLPAAVPLIGFVGKDSPVKNVPRFIEITRRLLAQRSDLHAVLAGWNLTPDARERLAPDLPADRVHLLGPRTDIPGVLASLDTLVLTSNSEGCPNVVLEALALGTPVVASDVGDVPLIIADQKTGFVVPPGDLDRYTAGVLEFLARGAEGREAVRTGWPALESEFGLEGMVARTVELWETILDRRKP